MMQATDFANRHDRTRLGELDQPAARRILVEREMSASPVIVREVANQDAAQVPFAEDEHVIQTLPPDRADEPLREWILPGAVRRRQDFTDAHALHTLAERMAVD
jgi:hypothetical protein